MDSIETPEQEEAWGIVTAINSSWVGGRADDLVEFFDEQIVFVAPGFKQRLEGRAACVESFREFCSKAKIKGLYITDSVVDVFGNTAIATYAFEIKYDLDSESFSESGRDMWVLVKSGEDYKAVWRTIVANESKYSSQ